jgi:hypothetical protein
MLALKKFLGTENGKIMKNLISKRKKKSIIHQQLL